MNNDNRTRQDTLSELEDKRGKNEIIETSLQTDERVIARVTDGIYREPSSALRELIANAYDADAEEVVVQTDAPRFDEIVVRDDGSGMSEAALVSLIERIGGSSKRTPRATKLGTSKEGDYTRSPLKGRKLVGKIGIGLFSVAQLTRQFQITTKQEGKQFRLVADVILNTWSDEELQNVNEGETFEAGRVQIRSVRAEAEGHGTEISIKSLLPRVKNQLRSVNKWEAIYDSSKNRSAIEPRFHIGKVDPDTEEFIAEDATVPWNDHDGSEEKFSKLVQSVVNEGKSRPFDLRQDFDNYLRTLWDVSLSIPINYINKHPFDISGSDSIPVYQLGNRSSDQAKKLELDDSEILREHLKLKAPQRPADDEFRVLFDGIELRRPQDLSRMPFTRSSLKERILFAGSNSTTFGKADRSLSGGSLDFEGYLLWAPRIAPKDHQGVMIRIHDASGTLFDQSFMDWQVAEIQKKRQITAEIFVTRGLEHALNIDRESFNTSHPHYQYIMSWLHNALRQAVNTIKRKEKEARSRSRKKDTEEAIERISEKGEDIITAAQREYGTNLDYYRFVEEEDGERTTSEEEKELSKDSEPKVSRDNSKENKLLDEINTSNSKNRYLNIAVDDYFKNAIDGKETSAKKSRLRKLKNKTKYLIMTLAAYGALDNLSDQEVDNLCKDISSLIIEDEF